MLRPLGRLFLLYIEELLAQTTLALAALFAMHHMLHRGAFQPVS